MKRDLRTIINITLLAALTLPQLALAQTYELPASVVGSGGGTSSSTNYSLSGTVGQPAADIGLASTSYKHDGGFWPAAQALTGVVAENFGSVAFNGFDARLSVGDDYPVDPANATPTAYQISGSAITLEAWIAPTHLPDVEGEIVTIIERRNSYSPRVSYALRLIYASELGLALEFIIGDGDGSISTLRKIWITTMIPGEWTHLAATYGSGVMHLFMNGVEIAAQTSSATIWPGDGGLHIGGLPGGRRFQGLIDEVRIWNVARTEDDIKADMNTPLAGDEPGLAGYWPLDAAATINGIYPVAEDKTANSNHLYMVEGAIALPVTHTDEVLIPPAVQSITANEIPKLITHVGDYFEFSPRLAGWPVPTLDAVTDPLPAGLGFAANAVSGTVTAGYEGRNSITLEATNSAGSVQGTIEIWIDQFGPHFMNHDNGNVTLSVFNNGVVGRDYQRWEGDGFTFGGYGSTLFQGNLVIAGASDRVSGGLSRYEFATRSNVDEATPDLPGFDQATVATFDDALAPTPLGISVEQRAYSKSTDPDRDYVVLVYTINNNSGTALDGIYIGLATDWDVGYDAFNNLGAYDEANRLSYVYEAGGYPSNPNYYGVAALTGAVSGFELSARNLNADAELYTAATNIGGNPYTADDLRGLLATGPYSIPNGDNIKVAFAVVGGSDLTDLKTNADRAWQVFNPLPHVLTLPPTNIAYDRANFNGWVDPYGSETVVEFEWWSAANPSDVKIAPATPSPITDVSEVAASVTALYQETEYQYRLKATNNSDRSAYGEVMSFITPSAGSNVIIDNQIVTGSGKVDFPSTDIALDFNYTTPPTTPATVEVLRFNVSPWGNFPPALDVFATRFWEINYDGPGPFTVDMTFVLGPGSISLEDLDYLENLRLLRRDSGTVDSWYQVGSTLSATDSSVTFTNLAGFSQYTVARLALDTEAPAITNLNAQQGGQWPFDMGGPIAVTVTVEDAGGLDYVKLYYSRGGPFLPGNNMSGYEPNWYGDIPSNDVTVSGVVYFVEAVDMVGNTAYSDTNYAPVHFTEYTLNTNIPGSAYPGSFPEGVWRLFSVPANLDDHYIENALSELGERNDRRWKIYGYWDGQLGENPPDLWLGEGYWIQQRLESGMVLDVGSGNTHDGEYTFELRPGWNLIGTPFPFELPINLDQGEGGFYGPISYGLYGSEGWSGVESRLKPWAGYAVWNRAGNNQSVTIKPLPVSGAMSKKVDMVHDVLFPQLQGQAGLSPKGTPPGSGGSGQTGWLLQLRALGETYADVANAVGRLEGATERLDYFDNPEPPYVDGFVSLAMERDDWGANLPRFTSDIRSIEETDGVWDLALYVKDEQGPITLTPELQGNLPTGNSIVLLDVITREVHDLLADDGPVTITDYREDFPYHLKVVAGSASYVDQTTEKILAELPSAFALAQNYPNPFNPDTHLRYSLIRPARVTLKVYNLLGQEVVTLVDGWQDLGHYEVIWDGRDRFGSQAATGIYFAVYMAEGRTFTRKMVMMK